MSTLENHCNIFLGHWLQNFRSLSNRLPKEITLNGKIHKCGTVLQDAEKCSCKALICDNENKCLHQTKPVAGFVYRIGCQLTKPWEEIDKEAATSGESEDCYCKARAIAAQTGNYRHENSN